jgi:hypothetical protein
VVAVELLVVVDMENVEVVPMREFVVEVVW